MHSLGYPLSPDWLRQLGKEGEAHQRQAQLQALRMAAQGPRQAGTRITRTPSKAVYEIEMIVDEKKGGRWFLVRWAGYHPSWEEWRT